MWTRRGLAASGFLAALGLVKTPGAEAAAGMPMPKVVYHLNEMDRVGLVLRSIANHYAGMDDEPIAVALVVHGGALRAFWQASVSGDVASDFADLIENGLKSFACSNTLRAQGITRSDLLPGFDPAECVGVVKLTQLQGKGYAYIRP
jgi:hypothetical protein